MRVAIAAIVLVGGLACGTESDPIDCLANGDDTICFDGVPGDTVTCDQIGASTFFCGAQQVRTNFGAAGSDPVRSEAAVIWKPRRVQMPAAVDRRMCSPDGHACVACATCDSMIRACVDCAAEGRTFRTEPVEPSREDRGE